MNPGGGAGFAVGYLRIPEICILLRKGECRDSGYWILGTKGDAEL